MFNLLFLVSLSLISLYFGICYMTTKSEKHKQEVNQLVENIIDLLKQQAQYRPNESYLPIIHIRDQLIPPNERQSIKTYFTIKNITFSSIISFIPEKSKIWAEVEQYFTESESRVRSEIQQIDGEDFQVLRWVQPVSPVTA